MTAFDRAVMEEHWQGWLNANRAAEQTKDWAALADWYAPDATYGWMYSPLREFALGTEMAGLDRWNYDYMAVVMDEKTGMVVGFWRQRAGILDDSGQEYEILGIGGSWFGFGIRDDGGYEFGCQRDWFDLGSTAHTFLEIAASGKARQGLLNRMSLHGPSQPGHYTRVGLPSIVWAPPVEAGLHITQARQGVSP